MRYSDFRCKKKKRACNSLLVEDGGARMASVGASLGVDIASFGRRPGGGRRALRVGRPPSRPSLGSEEGRCYRRR